MLSPEVLEGDHVRLRRWEADDAPAVDAIRDDIFVARWSGMASESPEAWIARQRARRDGVSLAVTTEGDPVAVGKVALGHLNEREATAELSYWVVPAARGQGLGRGVARSLPLGVRAPRAAAGASRHRSRQHDLSGCRSIARCRARSHARPSRSRSLWHDSPSARLDYWVALTRDPEAEAQFHARKRIFFATELELHCGRLRGYRVPNIRHSSAGASTTTARSRRS